ncbi:hypothetical protein ACFLU7_00775 [Chloroflexota bacterium]
MGLIIIAAFLVYKFTNGVIHRTIPDNPIYWIAAIVEIGLAFVVSFIPYRYVNNKNERKKRVAALIIAVIAIGVPIVFYHTNFAGLELIGGVFWWFILAGISIELSKSLRRPTNKI